jgi:hypothetical protein
MPQLRQSGLSGVIDLHDTIAGKAIGFPLNFSGRTIHPITFPPPSRWLLRITHGHRPPPALRNTGAKRIGPTVTEFHSCRRIYVVQSSAVLRGNWVTISAQPIAGNGATVQVTIPNHYNLCNSTA